MDFPSVGGRLLCTAAELIIEGLLVFHMRCQVVGLLGADFSQVGHLRVGILAH